MLNSEGESLRAISGDWAGCRSGATVSCSEDEETGRKRPVLRSPESEVIEESCNPLLVERSRNGDRDAGGASIVLLSVRVWPALRWVGSVIIAMTGLRNRRVWDARETIEGY